MVPIPYINSTPRIIALGGSHGALDPLRLIVAALPAELEAAVLVVLHVSKDSPGLLPEILNREGGLPAAFPAAGEVLRAGRIYVAPPDRHMLLAPAGAAGGGVKFALTHGPRENGHRPAVDPTFRDAARRAGSHCAGVILSGMLDDGASGLFAIHAAGGSTIVQAPESAVAPDMPRNALRELTPDWVLPAEQIGPRLAAWARTPCAPNGAPVGNGDASEATPFSCPECHGVLSRHASEPGVLRCRVGHAYGWEALARNYSDGVENALWVAMRALREKAGLARRLALRATDDRIRARFEQQAADGDGHADRIRDMIEQLGDLVSGVEGAGVRR